MTTDPVKLAAKVARYIEKQGKPVTYEELEQRAQSKGIDSGLFETAVTFLHKRKRVEYKAKGDTIVYTVKAEPKPKEPGSHLTWVRNNYKYMDETNNANHPAFNELDFSYLFLTPEEMKQFKIEQKGGYAARRFSRD